MHRFAEAVTRRVNPKTEPELWQELIQRQEDYARSLASLDAHFFSRTSCNASSPDMFVVEQAAEVRRVAYRKYRQAMADLAGLSAVHQAATRGAPPASSGW